MAHRTSSKAPNPRRHSDVSHTLLITGMAPAWQNVRSSLSADLYEVLQGACDPIYNEVHFQGEAVGTALVGGVARVCRMHFNPSVGRSHE